MSFDVFNKSAPWGSLASRENYIGKKNWYASSTGLKIADTEFKYGSNGVVGVEMGIWWNMYTTGDIKHFDQFINFTTGVLGKAVNNTIEVSWNQFSPMTDVNETQPFFRTSCDNVIKTMADVANCTNCTNWTPAKAKVFPEL